MEVTIQIKQPIDDWDDWVDAFELMGAKADDYDSETDVVSLLVDIKEVDMDYELRGGMFPHELHGATVMIEELDITVTRCKWGEYDVINDEDVCFMWEEISDE
jgi:hypothetical protein